MSTASTRSSSRLDTTIDDSMHSPSASGSVVDVEESWKRVLWKAQSYPDNYVPPEVFLASLQRNAHFRPYTYWPLVTLTCTITQHVAVIFVFLATFVQLNEHLLDPRTLVWICVACFLVCYTIWNILDDGKHKEQALRKTNNDNNNSNNTHLKVLKSSIMVFLTLIAISPVLRTLTAATSSDSIWALSSILFILNILLADYTATNARGEVHARLTSVLSMNAAISASVVLASRLETDISVFALILFAVHSFVLYPILKPRLQTISTPLWAFITLSLCTLSIYLLASLSTTVTALCAFVLFSITFVAPMLLVWAQKYKNNIRGPWDVAVPKVR